MDATEFANTIINLARKKGYVIQTNRAGLDQIDFGNKKLHFDHIVKLYPAAMSEGANINQLIEKVAPGRPCAHKPMRELINRLKLIHQETDVGV